MKRDELGDLLAFLAVAEAASFTRAAAVTGTSQAALSFSVQRLESRLGVRLLNRTTRRVATTEAGARLAATLRPGIDGIESQLSALRGEQERPAGLVRMTASNLAAESILWPAISELMPLYPELRVEINTESRFTDIVAERFDAGVRLGESLEADMVAVRIGPDLRMAVVASPSYLGRHGRPQTPDDLMRHNCINLRLPTMGNIYVWELGQAGRNLNVRVEGSLVFNSPALCGKAARDGHGIALLPEDQIARYIEDGSLIRLMDDWCQPFSGYHLYYPSRRQMSPALHVVIEKLKWRR